MRWRGRRDQVEPLQVEPPQIEIDAVELYASPAGVFAGLCWIILGLSIFGGLVTASVASRQISADGPLGRIVMIAGVVLAAPGVVYLTQIMLIAGVHLLRSRQGAIAFVERSIVIHDRWLLNEPIVIDRRDIAEIEALERLGFFAYSAFAGKAGRELGMSGALLDWGTRPNFRIVLHHDRQFLEAIRTLPSRSTLQPISKYRPEHCILIRVKDPKAASVKFDQWLELTADRTRPRPPIDPQSDPARFGLLVFIAFIGFVCFCLSPFL